MGRNFKFSVGEFYHIYNRGTDKRAIFLTEKDFQRFLILLYVCNSTKVIHASDYQISTLIEILNLKREGTLVDLGAYCLMPNHFHLLLHEKVENGISLFMQKVSTGYTMYFNKKNERNGALFEGRFRARHADTDEYFKYLFSYVHLNPVKILEPKWKEIGIKNKEKTKEFLSSYKYSSYLDYFSKEVRKEGLILDKNSFPCYFQTEMNFEKAIVECLSYKINS